MTASLNKKLRTVKWGEYKLGDLFAINPTKYYRLKNEEIISANGSVPLVSNASIDNGVMGFSNLQALNRGNSISCSDTTLGAETMYYQKDDYIGYQHIQSLIPTFEPFNQAVASFIISSARVSTSNSSYDYGHKFNRESMRNTVILLPTKDNAIDFAFMESFIVELEAERIVALSEYLTASGLDNYVLSKEEENALEAYSTYDWGTFNLKALYGKSTRGKRLKSEDRIPGMLPFVTAGEAEEGVSAFIGNDVEVFEKNTTTIDMFGSAKYRNYRYGGDDHVAIIHTEKVPMKAAIFVTSACHKAAHTGKFDYGHNFYAKDADALDIMLPTKDGKPDYQAMELLISAIQKLVIKDTVLYTESKISAAKGVVHERGNDLKTLTVSDFSEEEFNSENLINLPIVGEVAAGHEHFADDDILGEIGVDPSRLHPNTSGKHFFLRVSGDSMIGAGICDGDYVLIRRMSNPRADVHNGDIVVCHIHGDRATLQTYYREADHIRLHPDNEAYSDIIIPNVEFEINEARIIGKYIGTF